MNRNSSSSPSRRASNWRDSVRRLRAASPLVGAASALVLGLALAPHAQAQDNYTYTGTAAGGGTAAVPTSSTTFTGAFTDTTTNTPNTTPAATDNTLTFGGGATTYAATDDIASLTLQGLAFTNTTGSTVTINTANAATVNGTGATLGFAVSTGTVVFNPAINLGASTLAFSGGAAGSQTTIGGVISGMGGVTVGSAGTVTLNSLNTYTGGTTVNAGTLTLNTSSGTGNVQGAVTVNTGATLNLASNDALGYNAGAAVTTINVNGGTVTSAAGHNEGYLTSYSLTGGTVGGGSFFRFNVNAVAPPTISSLASGTTSFFNAPIDDFAQGGATANSNLTINVARGTTASGVDLQIGGLIQSGGGIIKTGAGYLNLTSGASTFTGNVAINAGTINIGAPGQNNGSASALGNTAFTSGTPAVPRTITVASGATLSGTVNNWFGNGQGNVVLPTITLNGGTMQTTRYTPVGALNLNGATVTSSVAAIEANPSYQSFALRGDVTVGGAAASTITSTDGKGVHLNANTTFTVAATTGTANPDLTVSAPLLNQSGDFGNAAGGFTKMGAGTMLLSATSTYTGATTVNAGSLVVTGSTATGSAVTVNNTGTLLGGTGTIGGTISVGSGAILSAGNMASAAPATGTLTTGALTLQTGSTFNALLASNTSFSTLNAVGTTSLTGAAFSISLTPGAAFANNSVLQLITSGVTGTFTDSVYTAGGYNFAANYTTDPGFFDVTITAVPEPSTWICGLCMVGLAGVSHRRKINGWLRAARV